jgi:hypothetical protein
MLVILRWLLGSPTAHYESIKLELSRARAPSYNSGTSLLGEGKEAHPSVSYGDQTEKQ